MLNEKDDMKKIICKICGREIETETGRMRSHLKPTIPNVWCNGRKRRPTQRAIDAANAAPKTVVTKQNILAALEEIRNSQRN